VASIVELKIINEPLKLISDLKNFKPSTVNSQYLDKLGVKAKPSLQTLARLECGSQILKDRLANGTLLPRSRVMTRHEDLNTPLEVHNYTGACPTLTFEINPVIGCHVGCQYCLVTDGSHEPEMVLLENYASVVANALEQHHNRRHFFYFSPKTEAFQEPTLQTGVAHDILRVFIEHFKVHPRSKARLFIASKAGAGQLLYKHKGESILDLFEQLKGRMQFNTSLSIMPDELRQLLEPWAASIDDRLAAVKLCSKQGVLSNSALVQPIILPSLTHKNTEGFFAALKDAGIVNFKPEFLTVNMENLSMIGQLLGYHDKEMERQLYDAYISLQNEDHKKQRDRTAPSRKQSIAALRKLVAVAARYQISTSICYWLRKELELDEAFIPVINHKGFQCLGYQTRLFEDPIEEINSLLKQE